MKKLIFASVAVSAAFAVFGADDIVPSGDVVALTNALAHTGSPYNVVQIEPGTYDLTGINMTSGSHLKLLYSKIKGLGAKPEDVKLVGDGTLRVLEVDSGWYGSDFALGARVENLMITNGCAQSNGGGGIYGGGTVTNCVIAGCQATGGNGGGIAGSCRIENCVISGCKAAHGGAVSGLTIRNSVIENNVATGWGGGLYSLTAIGCTIRNNFSLNSTDGYGLTADNAAFCNLQFCDISGTSVFSGCGYCCKVHDIGQSVTLTGNPFVDTEVTRSAPSVWVGGIRYAGSTPTSQYAAITNCLVYNNSDSGYNSGIFNSYVKSIVNCTIVNNRKAKTFISCRNTSDPTIVENSVFIGNYYNYYGSKSDLSDHSWDPKCLAGAVLFKNCAWGGANSAPFNVMADVTYPGSENYVLGLLGNNGSRDPGFKTVDGFAYALKPSSPLRKKGEVAGWMFDATDIAGNPRLSGGKVDIGCYQSPEDAGLTIIVK